MLAHADQHAAVGQTARLRAGANTAWPVWLRSSGVGPLLDRGDASLCVSTGIRGASTTKEAACTPPLLSRPDRKCEQ